MAKRQHELSRQERRMLTTMRRYGVNCYKKWGKSGWQPAKRDKRR